MALIDLTSGNEMDSNTFFPIVLNLIDLRVPLKAITNLARLAGSAK